MAFLSQFFSSSVQAWRCTSWLLQGRLHMWFGMLWVCCSLLPLGSSACVILDHLAVSSLIRCWYVLVWFKRQARQRHVEGRRGFIQIVYSHTSQEHVQTVQIVTECTNLCLHAHVARVAHMPGPYASLSIRPLDELTTSFAESRFPHSKWDENRSLSETKLFGARRNAKSKRSKEKFSEDIWSV